MSRFLSFFLVLTSLTLSLFAQNDRFYTSLNGLSGTTLYGFYQDSRGFLWIPTYAGLNRFDGYNFKVYQQDITDTTSLNSTNTNTVFEDSEGNLWVGTNYGLNLYNYKKDCFRQVHLRLKQREISLTVVSILEDKKKFLWLITSHGLVYFNPKTWEYTFFNHQFNNDGSPAYSKYNQAVSDPKGNLLIGTDDNGVLVFETSTSRFISLAEYTGIDYSFPDKTVLTVHQNQKKQILFGTLRAGIVFFDPHTGIFKQAVNSANPANLLDGGIYSITTDRRGTVWVGTERNGLKKYDPEKNLISDANSLINVPNIEKGKVHCYEDRSGDMWFGIQFRGIYHKISSVKPFHILGNSKSNNFNLSHYIVKSILRDKEGTLWIGTDGGGINLLEKGSNKFRSFNPSGPVKLTDKAIIKLYEDRKGRIWIGTYLDGVFCYQGANKPLIHYSMPGADKEKWNNYVFDIIEDAKGNLFIGSCGGGLFYLNTATGKIDRSSYPLVNGIQQDIKPFINTLVYSTDSTLWIGTYNGLYAWNKKEDTFRSFLMSKGDFVNEVIFALKQDNEGNIWIGTLSGLYCYRPGKKMQYYSTEQGMTGNSVMAIEFDKKNNAWVSTTKGISKLDISKGTFQNYYEYDGLPCNEYRPGASFTDKDGFIYFGGVDGMVYFDPDSIKNNPVKPNLIFTSFKVFNQTITPDPKNSLQILEHDINETDTIVLNYAHKSITLEFAAINFSVPEKISYAVMLEGFTKSWDIKDYQQRYTTFTNLKPGTYTLKIKSTDLDGVWIDQPRSLTLIVKPPFWLTWWAFIIYTLIIATIVYYIRKVAMFRITMKNQLHIEQVEREKQIEINQSKMQFFTNISHEIRTPLTMLLAPLEKLINSDLSETQKKYLNYIFRNTKRLERMVNQLLELQKIENVELRLHARKIELVCFVKEIIQLFEETAIDQKINISFEPCCDELFVWIDPEKMDKILFNLISNAIRYTPAEGLITITLKVDEKESMPGHGWFSISVSDTGKGIHAEHIGKIFDRFYQVESKEKGINIGTGIGLHLARELVKIHHGSIDVKSREGFGSTFTVQLPLGKLHLTEKELAKEGAIDAFYRHLEKPSLLISEVNTEDTGEEEENSAQNVILLVEDDLDILNYLHDELSADYQVIKANNGNDGWKLAFEKVPNLIICDIMMPGIDGLELCKRIKSTIETSHIPVIMLTAKTSVENEIEGLELGADEYLHKPFHPAVLKLKVDKIIESRELLKQQFAQNTSFVAKEMTVTSADELFLQKAIDYVKDNLADTDLNIEKLGKVLNISRVHLYRKLKAITNQNPTEFIRTIRLKQAAYLLSKDKLNVSEIAYMVGFNSHQYFTNSFQKYFNMSPTEYVKSIGQSTGD